MRFIRKELGLLPRLAFLHARAENLAMRIKRGDYDHCSQRELEELFTGNRQSGRSTESVCLPAVYFALAGTPVGIRAGSGSMSQALRENARRYCTMVGADPSLILGQWRSSMEDKVEVLFDHTWWKL